MKSKSILIIGLLIGLISFSTLISNSNAQFYLNTDTFEILEDPNIVSRRNLILHFLTLNFYVAGMDGFSDGIGGESKLRTTFEGISAVTTLFGQYKGFSIPILLWILGVNTYVKSIYGQIEGSSLPIEFYFGDTINFINSRWNITSKAYGEDSKSDINLYSTYYAVKSLELLGKSADSSIVNFVDSLQNDDGGFGSTVNAPSSLRATLYALILLKKFGRLDLMDNVTEWILQTQNTDTNSEHFGAFSSNKSDLTYTIYSTYEAIAALLIANRSLTGINQTAATNWIVARQNLNLKTGNFADYGGFSNPNDIRSTIPTSSAAIKALNLLGGLSKIKTFELIVWVLASQKLLYGGFGSSPGTSESSVSATYHALEIFKIYKWPLLLLLTQVPWQLKPELHWSLWLLILMIVFIVSIIILHSIWKRRRE